MKKATFFIRLLLCIVFLSGQTLYAQYKQFRVRITDEKNEPVTFGSIILTSYRNAGKTTKLLYPDSSGMASFAYAPDTDSVSLEINCLGFEISHLSLAAGAPPFVHCVLKHKQLEEVHIKAKIRVMQKGDTTRFNTAYFNKGNESTVEDALSQLPGVTVDENGEIHFKNQNIARVLIDGDDLFGKEYKALTKNLSAGAIDNVDIIEHQNDNALLNGIVAGSQQVINLHLKNKNKIITELNTESGLGAMSKQNGLRYSSRNNLLAINGKLKSVAMANMNNTGDDLASSLQSGANPFSATRQNVQTADPYNFILPKENFYTGISRKRTNFNESKILSWNGIYKITKNWNVTPQLYWSDSHGKQQYAGSTDNIVGDQTVVYHNSDTLFKKIQYTLLRLKSEWKPSNNTTVSYNGNFDGRKNNTYGNGMLQNQATRQQYKNNTWNVLHDILVTHKLNASAVLELEWLDNSTSYPQDYALNNLALMDSLFSYSGNMAGNAAIRQNMAQKIDERLFELRFYKKWNKSGLQLYAGRRNSGFHYNVFQRLFDSNSIVDSMLHNSEIRQKNDYIQGKYNVSVSNHITYLQNLTIARQEFDIDVYSAATTSLKKNFLESQSTLDFNIGLGTLSVTHIYKRNPPQPYQLLPFDIISDYRTINRGTDIFKTGTSNSFLVSFSYNDYTRAMLLYNAIIQYSRSRPNYLTENMVTAQYDFSDYNTVYPSGKNSIFGTTQHLEKYADFASGNFYLDINYQYSQSYYLSNGIFTTSSVTNRYFEFGFKSAWTGKVNMRTLIAPQWNTLMNSTDMGKNHYNNNYLKSSLELYFYPTKSLVLNTKGDYYSLPQQGSRTNLFFLDLQSRYTIKTDKLYIDAQIKNLFNQRNLSFYNYYPSAIVRQQYPLLPVYFILTAFYKF